MHWTAEDTFMALMLVCMLCLIAVFIIAIVEGVVSVSDTAEDLAFNVFEVDDKEYECVSSSDTYSVSSNAISIGVSDFEIDGCGYNDIPYVQYNDTYVLYIDEYWYVFVEKDVTEYGEKEVS